MNTNANENISIIPTETRIASNMTGMTASRGTSELADLSIHYDCKNESDDCAHSRGVPSKKRVHFF